MAKTIPLLDLTFFLLERKSSPTHVAALMLFKLPEDADSRFVAKLASAYRKGTPVPPFNWIPEFPPLGLPRWVDAGALNMRYHVRHTALPAGATWADLRELVGELHSQMLDRAHPCFRMIFIEGLPDRQFAMFFKVHHAMLDGASAIMRIAASLDGDADARKVRPIYGIGFDAPSPWSTRPRLRSLAALKSTAAKQAVALTNLYGTLLRKGLGVGRNAKGAGSAPFTAPRTPTNAPLAAGRSIATLSLPLDEMKSVGKTFGGTINDVAVTIVDAALHRYLEDLGAPATAPLVALCPLSLREAGDREATTKAATMFVPLGRRSMTLAKRMEVVVRANASAKAEIQGMKKDAAMLYSLAAFGLSDLASRSGPNAVARPAANLILSNVPGPRDVLHLCGARMTGIYPISGLGAGIGLNVTLISYAGSMDFGFVGNGATLPGLDRLAKHTQAAFAELCRAAARRRKDSTATAAASVLPKRTASEAKRAAPRGRTAASRAPDRRAARGRSARVR